MLTGCNILGIPYTTRVTINSTFTLTDTTGHKIDSIPSGKPFILTYTIKNTTIDTLTFDYAYSSTYFEIFRNQRMVTSSALKCPQGIYGGSFMLLPGESLKRAWKGPTSVCVPGPLYLLPGTYQAEVFYPRSPQVNIHPVQPITFSITPALQ